MQKCKRQTESVITSNLKNKDGRCEIFVISLKALSHSIHIN